MSMLTVKYPETVSVIATPVTEIYGSDGTVIAKAKLFYTPDRNDFNFVQTEELAAAGIAMHPYGAMLMPADATEPDYSKLVAHIKGEKYDVDTVADNVITFKRASGEEPTEYTLNITNSDESASEVSYTLNGEEIAYGATKTYTVEPENLGKDDEGFWHYKLITLIVSDPPSNYQYVLVPGPSEEDNFFYRDRQTNSLMYVTSQEIPNDITFNCNLFLYSVA